MMGEALYYSMNIKGRLVVGIDVQDDRKEDGKQSDLLLFFCFHICIRFDTERFEVEYRAGKPEGTLQFT